MGVKAIWDLIQGAEDKREPFSCFVARFYKQNGRPLRVAIDGYQWLVESSAGMPQGLSHKALIGKVVQGFHRKVRYMISLNVSFVIVFDGCYKPKFKRSNISIDEVKKMRDMDYDLHYFDVMEILKNYPCDSHDKQEVKHIKQMLKLWNIDYVEAPGDGEAECARLQRMGVVDYVISNDSDTLSFGANKILRNFSKYEENHSSASGFGLKQTTEFWVTPIRMDQVRRLKGYDCDRLVFISILCGADYNDGVTRLGAQRSSQLSLCGTSKIHEYSATFLYDELHDFSKELSDLYKTNADGLSGKERTLRYENFQQRVFDMVKQNSIALFGRNERHLTDHATSFTGWPPEFVVGLYYRPLICPSSKLFKFRDNTTNNAESSDPETAFTIPCFKEIYQQIKEYPLANLSNIALWYLKEMSSAYLLKHFRAHKTKVWEDDQLFKFQKVRFQKLGSEEPQTHVIELLSVKLMEHGLPHFSMEGLYIDSDTKLVNCTVVVDLLGSDLAHSCRSLEIQRARQAELRKSPKKASPDISLKRSPRKKKLGANTSPSKNFIQSILSPKKLPPSKAEKALSVLNAPPPILKLSSLNRSLTALKCSPDNGQSLEESVQRQMVFGSSISMSNMGYGSKSSMVSLKRITSITDCSSKGYFGASNLPASSDTDLFRIREKRLRCPKVADESIHSSKTELNAIQSRLGANPFYGNAIDAYGSAPPKGNTMILPESCASESYQVPALSISGSPSSQKTIININSDESSPLNCLGTSTRRPLVSQKKILLTDLAPVPVDHKINFGRTSIIRPAIAVPNISSSTDELLKPIPDKSDGFSIPRSPKRRRKSPAKTLDILRFYSPCPKNLPKESLIEEDVYADNTFDSDGPNLEDSAFSEAEMRPKNQALIAEGAFKLSSKRLLKRYHWDHSTQEG